LEVEVAAKTDVGRVRQNNEDSHLVLDLAGTPFDSIGLLRLVAVADGLGGHAAGGTASRMAIECLRDAFIATPAPATLEGAAVLLKRSFVEANERVHQAGAQPGQLSGMGTTMVAALVGEQSLHICNVGDSRAYVLNCDGRLQQITKDHSWEAEYAERFPEASTEFSGASNLLTRALGPQERVEVDEFSLEFSPGCTLVLCSDGLSRMVSDEQIENTLKTADSAKEAVQRLVEEANRRGGEDNITVIAVRAS
jgi:protein phosphatase